MPRFRQFKFLAFLLIAVVAGIFLLNHLVGNIHKSDTYRSAKWKIKARQLWKSNLPEPPDELEGNEGKNG